MSRHSTEELIKEDDSPARDTAGEVTRHPLTLENSPEETIKRMRAFPERAAKLTEIIRGLREKDRVRRCRLCLLYPA
jgi:hypothetical protein